MFCNSDRAQPERTHLRMWKQMKPMQLDKLNLLDARGNLDSEIHSKIPSRKSHLRVRVIVLMFGLYRLPFAKNIKSGKTTSSEATPPGDGRGIPKHFQHFGNFSKRPSVTTYTDSKPSSPLLAGFALRSRSTPSVFTSYNLPRTVALHLTKRSKEEFFAVIVANVSKMDDFSAVDSLFSLIDEADLDSGPALADPGPPEISDAELDMYLQELNPFDPPTISLLDFSTLDTSALNLLRSPSNLEPPKPPVASPSNTGSPPAPLDPLSPSPVNTQLPILLQPPQTMVQLKQIGPNTFEVITDNAPNQEVVSQVVAEPVNYLDLNQLVAGPPGPPSPVDLGYASSAPSSPSPSTSTSSLSPSLSTTSTASTSEPSTETREEKRLREQKEACKRYRENKKSKQDKEQKELEDLRRRNMELEREAQSMEEMVARCREVVMRAIGGKRQREGGDEEERGGKSRRT